LFVSHLDRTGRNLPKFYLQAIYLAGAFGIACATARADSVAPGAAVPASDEFVETPVGGAAAPQSSGSLLNPAPMGSQQFLQKPAAP
jgi:hypothetical protein